MYLADSMQSQTGYVILGLLSIEGNQSGYDIRRTIQGSVGYFWGESYGQIYPALKKLAAEGLIEPANSPQRTGAKSPVRRGGRKTAGGRPDRRAYSLTPAGRARLQEWLAQPFRVDPPRDEFLLKLFFGREAAPGVSVEHVRDFQQRNRRLLRTFEEIGRIGRAKNANHPHFRFWILTLEYGVAQIRAGLRWSEGALKELESMEKPAGRGQRKARQ